MGSVNGNKSSLCEACKRGEKKFHAVLGKEFGYGNEDVSADGNKSFICEACKRGEKGKGFGYGNEDASADGNKSFICEACKRGEKGKGFGYGNEDVSADGEEEEEEDIDVDDEAADLKFFPRLRLLPHFKDKTKIQQETYERGRKKFYKVLEKPYYDPKSEYLPYPLYGTPTRGAKPPIRVLKRVQGILNRLSVINDKQITELKAISTEPLEYTENVVEEVSNDPNDESWARVKSTAVPANPRACPNCGVSIEPGCGGCGAKFTGKQAKGLAKGIIKETKKDISKVEAASVKPKEDTMVKSNVVPQNPPTCPHCGISLGCAKGTANVAKESNVVPQNPPTCAYCGISLGVSGAKGSGKGAKVCDHPKEESSVTVKSNVVPLNPPTCARCGVSLGCGVSGAKGTGKGAKVSEYRKEESSATVKSNVVPLNPPTCARCGVSLGCGVSGAKGTGKVAKC